MQAVAKERRGMEAPEPDSRCDSFPGLMLALCVLDDELKLEMETDCQKEHRDAQEREVCSSWAKNDQTGVHDDNHNQGGRHDLIVLNDLYHDNNTIRN